MTIPLSLYIHFPWCVKKCPYCDFNSHTLREDLPEETYVSALLKDLRADLALVKNRSIHSIFMGGGTPSLFSPSHIAFLLKEIRALIPFSHEEIEVTLEANPGTMEQEKFEAFRQAGVNRLSIGVQSFQRSKLKRLGRIHNEVVAKQAVTAAKQGGFDRFNIDLMHSLPEQTLSDALADLQAAVSFAPPHLSWYELTLEPNTLFYHQPPSLPQEETLFAIYESGHQWLMAQGYEHYEVSAYCLPGAYCEHNLNYWEFGDYLGIGAGAHGKITCPESGAVTRYSKIKHPRAYLNASNFVSAEHIIEEAQLPFEFMLNALRLTKIIPWTLFTARTGLSVDVIYDKLMYLEKRQLLKISEIGFSVSTLGQRFLNEILTVFMPQNARLS